MYSSRFATTAMHHLLIELLKNNTICISE